jgi:hypothetical protein
MLMLAQAPDTCWPIPEQLLGLAQDAWVQSTKKIKWGGGGQGAQGARDVTLPGSWSRGLEACVQAAWGALLRALAPTTPPFQG